MWIQAKKAPVNICSYFSLFLPQKIVQYIHTMSCTLLRSLNCLGDLSVVGHRELALSFFLITSLVSSCVHGSFNHSPIDKHLANQYIFLCMFFKTTSGGYGQELWNATYRTGWIFQKWTYCFCNTTWDPPSTQWWRTPFTVQVFKRRMFEIEREKQSITCDVAF